MTPGSLIYEPRQPERRHWRLACGLGVGLCLFPACDRPIQTRTALPAGPSLGDAPAPTRDAPRAQPAASVPASAGAPASPGGLASTGAAAPSSGLASAGAP